MEISYPKYLPPYFSGCLLGRERAAALEATSSDYDHLLQTVMQTVETE